MNKKELYDLYHVKKLSQVKIAKIFGISQGSVHLYMKKHKIKSRTISESMRGEQNHFYGRKHSKKSKEKIGMKNSRPRNKPIKLNKKQNEILKGLLLSDGHIDTNNFSGRYTQGCKYKEFLKHIKHILPLEWGPIWYDKKWSCYHIKSHFTPTLKGYREKWYNNRNKTVPKNLKLSKETLLYWFLGDGSITFSNKKRFPKSKYFEAKLSTESFSRKDNKFLIKKLKEIGIKATLLSSGKIRILSESKEKLFEFMGSCPINCYQYKWGGVT